MRSRFKLGAGLILVDRGGSLDSCSLESHTSQTKVMKLLLFSKITVSEINIDMTETFSAPWSKSYNIHPNNSAHEDDPTLTICPPYELISKIEVISVLKVMVLC